jgi:hypothetical protein
MPDWHVVPEGQATQAWPNAPHAELLVPDEHWPFKQQPEHVCGPQPAHVPLTHWKPMGHETHCWPAMPHCRADGITQPVLLQQPLGHVCALHTEVQVPLRHC